MKNYAHISAEGDPFLKRGPTRSNPVHPRHGPYGARAEHGDVLTQVQVSGSLDFASEFNVAPVELFPTTLPNLDGWVDRYLEEIGGTK